VPLFALLGRFATSITKIELPPAPKTPSPPQHNNKMLKFATSATSLLVSGTGTFHIKDILKSPQFRGRWDPDARSWALPIELDTQDLRAHFLTAAKDAKKRLKDAEQEKRIFDSSPEGKAILKAERKACMRAALEEDEKRKARGELPIYWYICCEDCEIISSRRGQHMTTCDTCADRTTYPWPLTTKINGVWYTGD
jgi:hypothetical protein